MKKNKEFTIDINNDVLAICSKYAFISKCVVEISRNSWNELIIHRPEAFTLNGEAIPQSNIEIRFFLNGSKIPFIVDLNTFRLKYSLYEKMESSLFHLDIKQQELTNFFIDITLMLKQKKVLDDVCSSFLTAVIPYPQSNRLAKNIKLEDKKTKKPYYNTNRPF